MMVISSFVRASYLIAIFATVFFCLVDLSADFAARVIGYK